MSDCSGHPGGHLPAHATLATRDTLTGSPRQAMTDQDIVPIFCQARADRGQNGVKKVKGDWESELVVRDNNTGQFESFPVGSGTFKSNREGIAEFDFESPTELFADGFESGDVSAWSYTRADFTNKKKADNAQVQCGKGASRGN